MQVSRQPAQVKQERVLPWSHRKSRSWQRSPTALPAKIGQNILSLVEKTSGIVSVMDTIKDTLEHQEINIDKTRQIFSEIASDIAQITDKEITMQTNVSEMNLAKDNMSHIISELSESAIDNAALSQSATDATERMMYEIENLETLTEDLTELAGSLDGNLKAFLL